MELKEYFDLKDLDFVSLPFIASMRRDFEEKLEKKHSLIPSEQRRQGFFFYQALVFYARLQEIDKSDKVLYYLTLLYLYVDAAMDIEGVSKEELYRQFLEPTTSYWLRVHHYMRKCQETTPSLSFYPLLQAQIISASLVKKEEWNITKEKNDPNGWSEAYNKGYETGIIVDQLLGIQFSRRDESEGGHVAGLVQIVDDLLDIPEDSEAGIVTPATIAYTKGSISSLLSRLSKEASKMRQPWPTLFSYAIAFIVQKYPTHVDGLHEYREPVFDKRWQEFYQAV